jgi:endothelin-converting enzyme/putative endopeptidase
MDKAVDPCVDFYQYACGTWMTRNPIPADRSRWSRFEELADRNQAVLLDILQRAAQPRPGRSEMDQKIGDYFAACVDEEAINRKGIEPLRPVLSRIAKLGDASAVMAEAARLHAAGAQAIFLFSARPDYKDSNRTIAYLDQGGLSLPDREYYLKTDARSVEIRKKFEEHVAKVFALLGDSAEAAAGKAGQVMALETALANGSMDRVSRRDPNKTYHPMTRKQLAALAPAAWDDYFRTAGAPAFETLNVTVPDFFKLAATELRRQPVEVWKAYFTYQAVRAASAQLPSAFENEVFDFYQRTLAGTKEMRPRAKRCIEAVDRQLGDLLGQKYVELRFGPAAREQMGVMVAALHKALEKDVRELPWMTDETRRQAIAKLKAITNNVGVPKKWRDYSSVAISRTDALGNAMRAAEANQRRILAKIGKPTDRTEWTMTTPTVNAFYSSQNNSINFPAGILQAPFFDPGRDAAANFGGIGAVIGHELTHGFDDSGRKFDGDGNLRDWWTPRDGQEFEKRAACFADQYSSFTAVDDVKINGRLTLGENTADSGGVRIALMALLDTLRERNEKVDGFTPEQRFFLGFAQIWCQNITPEQARQRALTDPHSPGRYRVNGTFQNSPEFQRAWSCQASQPMVSANACRVW